MTCSKIEHGCRHRSSFTDRDIGGVFIDHVGPVTDRSSRRIHRAANWNIAHDMSDVFSRYLCSNDEAQSAARRVHPPYGGRTADNRSAPSKNSDEHADARDVGEMKHLAHSFHGAERDSYRKVIATVCRVRRTRHRRQADLPTCATARRHQHQRRPRAPWNESAASPTSTNPAMPKLPPRRWSQCTYSTDATASARPPTIAPPWLTPRLS